MGNTTSSSKNLIKSKYKAQWNTRPSLLTLADKYIELREVIRPERLNEEKRIILPMYVDLRSNAGPVLDMGKIPCNTVCSVITALHIMLLKQELEAFPPSRLWILRQFPEDTQTITIRDVLEVTSQVGLVSEVHVPYNSEWASPDETNIPDFIRAKARLYQNIEWNMVPRKLDHIRVILESGFPIIAGFTVYTDLKRIKEVIWMPNERDTPQGGFSTTLVGYREDKQMFIAQMPFGRNWGQGGFCLIPYDYILSPIITYELWTVRFDADRIKGQNLKLDNFIEQNNTINKKQPRQESTKTGDFLFAMEE